MGSRQWGHPAISSLLRVKIYDFAMYMDGKQVKTQALLFLQTLSNLSQTLSAAGIGQTVPKGHSSRTSPPRCVIPKVLRLVCCALTVTVRDIWWKLHPYTSSSLGDHGNSCDSLSFGVLLQLLFCP